MGDVQYNLQFEKLCEALKLGEMVSEPEALAGGFLNRMYAVETDTGKYAIKALNPQIMLRPTAMRNYLDSERIARFAAGRVPALPAKVFNGEFMHEIDRQYYLVFGWAEGKSLKPDQINTIHCKKMGAVLAELHQLDDTDLDLQRPAPGEGQVTDWNFYLQKGRENGSIWAESLRSIVGDLYRWNTMANKAAGLLTSELVISHRDMDPKNVLWDGDSPVIIDWEAAGLINPMRDAAETALNWSRDEDGAVDKGKLLAFFQGYQEIRGKIHTDWKPVLASGFSFNWLEYNLKRSLWMECTDQQEQQMGTAQVLETIQGLLRYAALTARLEQWLTDEI